MGTFLEGSRPWQVPGHCVEHGLNADAIERRTAEHRHHLPGDRGRADHLAHQRRRDECLGQCQLRQFVGVVEQRRNELLAPLGRQLGGVGGDRACGNCLEGGAAGYRALVPAGAVADHLELPPRDAPDDAKAAAVAAAEARSSSSGRK